jgi:hypothetical protein
MRSTLPVIVALATGAGLPTSLRAEHERLANGATVPSARARADKLRAGLPPLVDEDVRMVGALAELFAAAAAERLMSAGLRLGAGPHVYGRASSEAKRKAMRPTLPIIALATGAALCTQVLAQQASRPPRQGKIGQNPAGAVDPDGSVPGRSSTGARCRATPTSTP